ncbi:hypothetical protein Nepgr_024485 [Nepenthes gracilis]|uniref:Chlororespiratory reduction31 n=1 Tax=Nepenthes gracilis TaxID=150966 RepID=A0AAD3T4P1_NEPGR|nr:hypothetical protein Nepgr_024485 [Nepenthes gracilis]
MASSFSLPTLQGPLLHKSNFLGQLHVAIPGHKSQLRHQATAISTVQKPSAKFNLFELLGGRGLCNGEEGLQRELKTAVTAPSPPPPPPSPPVDERTVASGVEEVPENAFEKELLGLTGGFPGGERGLQNFIEKNPPPEKSPASGSEQMGLFPSSMKKPEAPELPLLLPGMIVVVKNPSNPFYNYCGIVQRITDGKAGVLFEGGTWDKLITFRLEELQRREKGPPGVNPKSVILEEFLEKKP